MEHGRGYGSDYQTGLDGRSNLTDTFDLNTCGTAVAYWGNGWAPPDPESGGFYLVGGGTITPPGTVPWSAEILASGTAQVTINSSSTNCPPTSAGINLQTTYQFYDPHNSSKNRFGV